MPCAPFLTMGWCFCVQDFMEMVHNKTGQLSTSVETVWSVYDTLFCEVRTHTRTSRQTSTQTDKCAHSWTHAHTHTRAVHVLSHANAKGCYCKNTLKSEAQTSSSPVPATISVSHCRPEAKKDGSPFFLLYLCQSCFVSKQPQITSAV